MASTRAGGLKAAVTNKKLYGEDFYKRIGKAGGSKSTGGGFAANPGLASIVGKLGGHGGWDKAPDHVKEEYLRLKSEKV